MMRARPIMLTLAMVVALALPLGIVPAVSAAPRAASGSTVQVTEVAKNIIPETSIAGPSFATLTNATAAASAGAGASSSATPSATPTPTPGSATATSTSPSDSAEAALAWTGTDEAHRLNVMLSRDGLHYTAKQTLYETSPYRPSVLLLNRNGVHIVVLAWTGTDPQHRLNILYDVYGVTGSQTKITLYETSDAAPSIASFGNQIWLAWTGTDPHHSLNVREMGANGLTPGPKVILGLGEASAIQHPSAIGGPRLVVNPRTNALQITWARASAPHNIDMATSTDGMLWTPAPIGIQPPESTHAPDLLALTKAEAASMPLSYWVWRGTNQRHNIALLTGDANENWQLPVITLGEWTMGAPAVGYMGNQGQIVIVWTGTDPQHTLNAAVFRIN